MGIWNKGVALGKHCRVKNLFDKFSLLLYLQIIHEQTLICSNLQSWSNRICQILGSLSSVLDLVWGIYLCLKISS